MFKGWDFFPARFVPPTFFRRDLSRLLACKCDGGLVTVHFREISAKDIPAKGINILQATGYE
jgi:hypothetical protein